MTRSRIPGKPVAHNYGLLSMDYGPLWGSGFQVGLKKYLYLEWNLSMYTSIYIYMCIHIHVHIGNHYPYHVAVRLRMWVYSCILNMGP